MRTDDVAAEEHMHEDEPLGDRPAAWSRADEDELRARAAARVHGTTTPAWVAWLDGGTAAVESEEAA